MGMRLKMLMLRGLLKLQLLSKTSYLTSDFDLK